jgi:hypothetical protein
MVGDRCGFRRIVRLLRLKKRFDAAEDSPDRRVARRVLYGLRAQGMAGNNAMRKLMDEILPR